MPIAASASFALVLSLLALTPAAAIAEGGGRHMKLCNSYPRAAYFAFAEEQQNGTWTSRGWTKVRTGTCRSGPVLKGAHIFWRAETDQYRDPATGQTVLYSWGKGRKFCVTDRAFTFNRADASCSNGRSEHFVNDMYVVETSGLADETISLHKDGTDSTTIPFPKD